MGAVRLRPEAEADLLLIAMRVALSSESRADKLVATLRRRCEILVKRPMAGRERPELGNALRSLVERPYVIIYRVIGDDAEIVAFVHGARDIASVMARRTKSED